MRRGGSRAAPTCIFFHLRLHSWRERKGLPGHRWHRPRRDEDPLRRRQRARQAAGRRPAAHRGRRGPRRRHCPHGASLRQAAQRCQGGRLAAIGIDAPGPVDYAHGIITTPPNLPGWHDVPLASIIGKEFGVPCVLENDANAAALAEHRWGSGRGSRDMLFLTVSSGIGGGIIIDGKLYRGASGAAGEVGHMTIDIRGPRCHCGRRGCLEMYASGLAIARLARRLVGRHPRSLLARMAREQPLTAKLVHEASDRGDEDARSAHHRRRTRPREWASAA